MSDQDTFAPPADQEPAPLPSPPPEEDGPSGASTGEQAVDVTSQGFERADEDEAGEEPWDDAGHADAEEVAEREKQLVKVRELVAEKVSFVAHQVNQYHELQSRSADRRLSAADGEEASEARELESEQRFVGSEEEVSALLRHLQQRRILVLSGPRGSRRGTMAAYLALRLRRAGVCGRRALVFDAPERHVRLALPPLVGRAPEVQDRVVVFRNAFGRGNADLAAFFEKTDGAGWEHLAGRLRERRAFLVFTVRTDEAAAFGEARAVRALHQPLADHSPQALQRALVEKLAELETRDLSDPELPARIRADARALLAHFRFAPALQDFLEFCVRLERPGVSVQGALRRFEDTQGWLLDDVDGDPESWIFGITLALAHAAHEADGVPWVEFDRLQRAVRQWLRRDLGLAGGPRAGDDDEEAGGARVVLSDDVLLRRCDAVVRKDPVRLADVVRFRDGGTPRRLWDAMLERNRRVLTGLLPRLRDLAERNDADEGLRPVQSLAAAAVGRLGEIDPHRIVFPLADGWARSPRPHLPALVGALLRGAMGTGDERYRRAALAHLTRLRSAIPRDPALDDAQADAAPEASAERTRLLEAVVAGCTSIGADELPTAMRELGEMARVHLLPQVDRVQAEARSLGKLIQRREARRSAPGMAAGRKLRALLGTMVYDVQPDGGELLLRVQTALVRLCGEAGMVPVLRQIGRWSEKAGWKMGLLVATLFLNEHGVLDGLATRQADGAGEGPVPVHPVLAAAAADEEQLRQVARFLGDLYECIAAPAGLEPLLHHFLRQRLAQHLLGWTLEAARSGEHTAAMRRLLETLARMRDGAFHGFVAQLLARRELTAGSSESRAFAASVRIGPDLSGIA